jgi:hypothetical protein
VRALPVDQQVLIAKAVEMVRNGDAPDFVTAAALLAPTEQNENQADPFQDNPTQEQRKEDDTKGIIEIQKDLEALREQRKAAIKDFDTEAQSDLTDAIEEKTAELAEMKAIRRIEAVRNQENQANYQKQYEATVEEIEELYPALQDDQSSFSRVFDSMVLASRAREDAILSDPTHLRVIAAEVASLLQMPATKSKQTTLPAPPPRTIANGSAVAPGHTQAPQLSNNEAFDYIKNATLDQLDALIDG